MLIAAISALILVAFGMIAFTGLFESHRRKHGCKGHLFREEDVRDLSQDPKCVHCGKSYAELKNEYLNEKR